MLKFFAGAFAVAGLIAAAGPIIIHLLNRRRFRVVEWGAMDFLRRAMQRSRRVVQLRDLILLVLRCLAVAVFGAALARPFVSGISNWTLLVGVGAVVALIVAIVSAGAAISTGKTTIRRSSYAICGVCSLLAILGLASMLRTQDDPALGALTSRQPVHAVLLLDNSMSMGYESLDGTLLDRAKEKAVEFLDALPAGSQIHIVAMAGSNDAETGSSYRNKADARAAIDRVAVVDRIALAGHALDTARTVCRSVPELPSKRVVMISDQQTNLWSGASHEQFEDLPDFQLMRIAPDDIENVAVTEFHLQDGVADTQTPAAFLATISYTGAEPLSNVQVTLTLGEDEAASQLVDLEPGQSRQVEFRQLLDAVSDTGALGDGVSSATFLEATVSVQVEGGVGDGLSRDNSRHLVIPVVSGLPVVFVDQYGEDEDLDQGEVGESYRLRRLLAPRTSNDAEEGRQLVRVRHLSIDRLTEDNLSDARLVVVSGVESPGESVSLLRQYVEQGGALVITAGASFDPDAWHNEAWLDGAGILPLPLTNEPVGQLPEVAVGKLEHFYLDFQSLQHDFFLIEGEPREGLEDLYRLPFFFKATAVEDDDATLSALVQSESERLTESRRFLLESDELRREWDEKERQGNLSDDETADRRINEERRREVRPEWLQWRDSDRIDALDELTPEQLAVQGRPRVLGRYTLEDRPFLVERRVGAGRILLVTTGVYSSWNTLTGTNAILMFDRMLRQLLEDTLPQRTFETGEVVALPARKSDLVRWELEFPDSGTESLPVEALSADRFGVQIRRAVTQGHYGAVSIETTGQNEPVRTVTKLAFNCPPEESQLETLDSLAFQERLGEDTVLWLEADEVISVEGAQVSGRDLWKWLISAVLIFLLGEMSILAWPNRTATTAANGDATPDVAAAV